MTEASPTLDSTNNSKAVERIPELDGLRGLAVLMVMAYHAFAYEMVYEQWYGFARLLAWVTNLGWLGVDLFFVLSGFLITGVLLRTRQDVHYLGNFYWRRALRILPLYFLILLVVVSCYANAGWFVLLSAVFLSNLVTLFGVPLVYGPLWSLAVEEHFYLFWPWVVRALTPRRLAWLATGVAFSQPLARGAGFLTNTDIYYFTWFRLDGLAWGALLACLLFLSIKPKQAGRQVAIVALGLATMLSFIGLPFGLLSRQRIVGAMLLFSIAQLFFLSLLAWAWAGQGTKAVGVLRYRWLRQCGIWSYCLYLIHLLLLQAFDWIANRNDGALESLTGKLGYYLLRAGIALPVAFLFARFSFQYFESPLLRKLPPWSLSEQRKDE
ncbi:MAG: acyltransferase [Acidobacteria bacterium]|nr:acyltransferase [Acidobacteriota bacterium]